MHRSLAHKPGYRKDIDGLRAVAIISVLLSHYFPSFLPGGFVGVDIFFVISGYLITNLIIDEIAVGAFSATAFYARRARRIFPALIACLVSVLLAGWLYFLPQEFEALGLDVSAGAIFLANVDYWLQVGYFDTLAELKPLLHLWSLGIEEQFYILWPALLLVFYRFRLSAPILIVILILISFGMEASTVGGKSAVFYLLHARFWELLVGALLVNIQKKNYFSNNDS